MKERKTKVDCVYAQEPFPVHVKKSIFLAGPTPRETTDRTWRDDALDILKELGYNGTVFLPISRDRTFRTSYEDQIEWEDEGLNRADCIVFWIPRDPKKLPGLTTNHEHGEWLKSGKIVLGTPPGAAKVRYLQQKARQYAVPQSDDLRHALHTALERIGEGSERHGAESQVPLHIWRTESFQSWYQAQKAVGNSLVRARVEWTFSYGPQRELLFLWVLRATVFIAAEERMKRNEFVLGRPDIACVLLFFPGSTLLDTTIVLVREFRTPARTSDGCIHELPGGSSWTQEDMRQIARSEVQEEAGVRGIPLKRFRKGGSRQLYGTLSSNHGHLYTVLLTKKELADLRRRVGIPLGIAEHGERTFLEIVTVRELLHRQDADWSTLGMVLSALLPQFQLQ